MSTVTNYVAFVAEQSATACHHPWADHYLITGVDRQGKRFAKNCGKAFRYALGHNVWNGNLWAVRPDGGRVHILRWSN